MQLGLTFVTSRLGVEHAAQAARGEADDRRRAPGALSRRSRRRSPSHPDAAPRGPTQPRQAVAGCCGRADPSAGRVRNLAECAAGNASGYGDGRGAAGNLRPGPERTPDDRAAERVRTRLSQVITSSALRLRVGGALSSLTAQAFDAVSLIGGDLASKRQARIEVQMRDRGEHLLGCFRPSVQLTDDAALVTGIADPGNGATRRQDNPPLLA